MRARQKGITFIGWLFLLVPVAIVGYSAIRVTPKYLTYYKVVKVLKSTAADHAGEDTVNTLGIRRSLYANFDTNSIVFPTVESLDIRRVGERWVITADYEEVAPLFGNISLLLKFNKAVTID